MEQKTLRQQAVKTKEVLFVCKSGFLVVISGVFMKIWVFWVRVLQTKTGKLKSLKDVRSSV